MTPPDDLRETRYNELPFAVRRSVRYHRHRQRFPARVHHLRVLLTAFSGSATVAPLLAELPPRWTWVRLFAAALTALASATQLVFGPARAACRHDSLAVSFLALDKDLLRAGPSLPPQALVEPQSRRPDIEATEPPVYRVLDAICHDESLTGLGSIPPSAPTSLAGSACRGTSSMSAPTRSENTRNDHPQRAARRCSSSGRERWPSLTSPAASRVRPHADPHSDAPVPPQNISLIPESAWC